MRNTLIVQLWILFVIAPRAIPAEPTRLVADFSALDAVVMAELQSTKTPGAAVALVRGDRVVLAKGYGVANVETREPVGPDTLFRLGSTTKMFTAAALVDLAGDGKLRLDESVGRHVEGLRPRYAALTPHQLLTHTAGLRDAAPMSGPHEETALGEGIRAWADDWQFCDAGQIWSYSNPGYWLAGFTIECVDRKPYADALDARLFQPLGMTRTTFRPLVAMTWPVALGHDVVKGEIRMIRPQADNAATWPAGQMYSTVTDLARFAIAFLNDGKLDGRTALKPAVIRKLSTPYVEIAGESPAGHYGYGLHLTQSQGLKLAEHGGSRAGNGSRIRFLPDERMAVIILANRSGARLPKTLTQATALLLGKNLNDREEADFAPRPAQSIAESDLAAWVGVYSDNVRRIEITLDDGRPHLHVQNQRVPINALGDARFTSTAGNFVLALGADGQQRFLLMSGRALRKLPSTTRDAD